MFRFARPALATTLVALALSVVSFAPAMVVPATAKAGYDVIYIGSLSADAGIVWGPRHSLTSVWDTWYDGYDGCLNAWNDSGGWAGSTYCAGPYDTNVGHPYCGCRLRWGAGWATGNDSVGYWRQFW